MEDDQQEADLAIQIAEQFKSKDLSPAEIDNIVRAICNRFGLVNASISIALVGDEQISRLNEQFLGRKEITDCLSFDLSDEQGVNHKRQTNDSNYDKSLEIVINAEIAEREARERGHSTQAELALYVTHGLLHQLGFDDQRPQDARKMHKMENEILQQLGYPLVYSKGH